MSERFAPGIHPVHFEGEPAWHKQYGGRERRWRLRLLDLLVRLFGITALRPPPHPVGTEARALEAGRLRQLAAAGVRVPRILAEGDSHLVLSDLGETLPGRLRGPDPDSAGAWFVRAARSIAGVHAGGNYLGQPQARNIVVDAEGRIGFIDFEEDPRQIMDLADAQARDWLLFMAGTARHVPHTGPELGGLLRPILRAASPQVRESLQRAVRRLGFLGVLARLRGPRVAGLGKAVLATATAMSERR